MRAPYRPCAQRTARQPTAPTPGSPAQRPLACWVRGERAKGPMSPPKRVAGGNSQSHGTARDLWPVRPPWTRCVLEFRARHAQEAAHGHQHQPRPGRAPALSEPRVREFFDRYLQAWNDHDGPAAAYMAITSGRRPEAATAGPSGSSRPGCGHRCWFLAHKCWCPASGDLILPRWGARPGRAALPVTGDIEEYVQHGGDRQADRPRRSRPAGCAPPGKPAPPRYRLPARTRRSPAARQRQHQQPGDREDDDGMPVWRDAPITMTASMLAAARPACRRAHLWACRG
jgi:hypothetical protein